MSATGEMCVDTLLLLGLLAVPALLAFVFAWRRPRADQRPARPMTRPAAVPVSPTSPADLGADATPDPAPASTVMRAGSPIASASLLDFQWQTAESMPDVRAEMILDELKRTPPPPRAFHQLVSPAFVARASSAELAELVIGVPLAATQVLARVNSAFYGLPKPVGNLGQAITYLGLNSVRAICLQYMMEASFTAHAPALKRRFDQLWATSSIAGELSQKLAQRLQLPEAGGLVTEVALSSLGHFATAILMPREGTAASSQTLLARSWAEQSQLGAPAAEIGALLMRAWGLPEVLVEDVRAIDRMLVRSAAEFEPHRGRRLAAGYLSVRLGERLARGDAVDLGDLEGSVLAGDDYFRLRAGLQPAERQALADALRSPELARSVQKMLATLQEPHAA